jgi:hypothetical protein
MSKQIYKEKKKGGGGPKIVDLIIGCACDIHKETVGPCGTCPIG